MLEYHKGTSVDFLTRFEDQWRALWENRVNKAVCLLTTCSHAKPYAKSYIHSEIRKYLKREGWLQHIDIVHLSSAGIIPTEAGSQYPFCAYDWNDAEATVEERLAYVEVARQRLEWWIEKTKYLTIVGYFNPEDDNLPVLQSLNIPYVSVEKVPEEDWVLESDVDDCLVAEDNLRRLAGCLYRNARI